MKFGSITITSPVPGQLIERPDTLVRGTLDLVQLPGDDIGVTVNGVVAQVYGNQFAANHVPLIPGDNNTITAIATTSSDYAATDTITVSADTTGNYLTLESNQELGLSPLDVTLSLAKTFEGTGYSFSYEPDDGTIENLGDNATTMQFNRRLTDPGLYFITANDVEVVDNVTSVTHADTIAILAEDRTALDLKLKGKWAGMMDGFAVPSIEKPLAYISFLSKDKYREAFTQLLPQLSTIAADLQGKTMELIYMRGNIVQYRVYIDETINGELVPITYFIYFIRDMDGLWKLDQW